MGGCRDSFSVTVFSKMNRHLRILFGYLGVMAAVYLTGQAALAQDKPKTRADSHAATQGQQCLYLVYGSGAAAVAGWMPSKLLSKPVDTPALDVCNPYAYDMGEYAGESPTIFPQMVGTRLTAFDAQGVPVGGMKISGVSRLSGCTDPPVGYVMEEDDGDTTTYPSSGVPSFATGQPLLPAAEVRAATPAEMDKARAFMLSVGPQLGIPLSAFSSPKKKTDGDEIDPEDSQYGMGMTFVDFNRDGLPDLIGTFYHKNYSMLVIARNTGDGFASENKMATIRPPATSAWSDYDDAPPNYSYYGSFNVGDADDLIAIDKSQSASSQYEEIMVLQRNTNGHWRVVNSAELNTGCD